MKASDVPQWRWNRDQCREWIAEVLVEYGCMDRSEAERKAEQFQSFGPSLYGWTHEQWQHGFDINGQSISALLVEMRDMKGAKPQNVVFNKISKQDGKQEEKTGK